MSRSFSTFSLALALTTSLAGVAAAQSHDNDRDHRAQSTTEPWYSVPSARQPDRPDDRRNDRPDVRRDDNRDDRYGMDSYLDGITLNRSQRARVERAWERGGSTADRLAAVRSQLTRSQQRTFDRNRTELERRAYGNNNNNDGRWNGHR